MLGIREIGIRLDLESDKDLDALPSIRRVIEIDLS